MMSSWFQCAIYPLDTRIGGRRFLWKIVVRSKCGGNMRIGMRDRSKNRKPLQKGRNLSIEAIQAVQALKRVASKNDDAVAVEQVFNSKIRRLLKSDMIAVLRELLRQNQCLLALKVSEARHSSTLHILVLTMLLLLTPPRDSGKACIHSTLP
ncbi:putative cellulose synthase-like protein D4-like [Capsicum annuum]|nr:putative cellulose synthase-like protein D4-like [Capsicum annuum]KAF3673920.1 putative cellulose synthase-like protein D4-like [Capsicum annuum]